MDECPICDTPKSNLLLLCATCDKEDIDDTVRKLSKRINELKHSLKSELLHRIGLGGTFSR